MNTDQAIHAETSCFPLPAGHGLMLSATILIAIIDGIWCVHGRWRVESHDLAVALLAIVAVLLPLAIPRYRSEPGVRSLCTCSALLLAFSQAAAVLSYLVASTNAPLVDQTLDLWDKAIGFDWPAVFIWVREHQALHIAFTTAYISVLPQIAFVLIFLSFTNRRHQLAGFTAALAISFVMTVVVSGFFPAGEASEFHMSTVVSDVSAHTDFAAVRAGALRTIHLLDMQGLISMPSFHTVLAILLAYAMRNTRLAMPFIVLNIAVILSTPTEGGHYLVDVFGGILTAALAMALASAASPARCA